MKFLESLNNKLKGTSAAQGVQSHMSSAVTTISPGTSGGLSLRNEYVMHQIEQLEEKKKILANELLTLHVQIINTKKEYSLYHKSLLKLKKTIEFIQQSEEHLAKEKLELNEVRSLLETQRKQAMGALSALPAREKAVEQRESAVSLREKEVFAREALLAGRESALLEKERFLSDQSLRTSQAQTTTQASAAQLRAQESHTRQLLAKVTARETELKALETSLSQQAQAQAKREHDLTALASHLETLKIQLGAERKMSESQRQQLTHYAKQLQHQTTLVQHKANELAQKESRLLLDSTTVYPYQVAATQVGNLQQARAQLSNEIDGMNQQVAMLKSELSKTQTHLAAARNELSAIAQQRLSLASEYADAQGEMASRERLLIRKEARLRHK